MRTLDIYVGIVSHTTGKYRVVFRQRDYRGSYMTEYVILDENGLQLGKAHQSLEEACYDLYKMLDDGDPGVDGSYI